MNTQRTTGFTIVELLIVVVVIAILAAITIVSYNGIQNQANASSIKADLSSAAKHLALDRVRTENFPANLAAANGGKGVQASNGAYFRYRPDNSSANKSFCLAAINPGTRMAYSITESGTITEGSCFNLALGATSPTTASTVLTDGNTSSNPYYNGPLGLQSVIVDLGSVQDVSTVKIWHYYVDGRSYNQTKTEVSEDGTNWTTIFDSATEGTYAQNAAGKTTNISMQKVRYIRDWINGSTSNTGNHWVEIQAY